VHNLFSPMANETVIRKVQKKLVGDFRCRLKSFCNVWIYFATQSVTGYPGTAFLTNSMAR